MKNPYKVLKVSQNATKEEVQKAFIQAQKENIKTKQYSGKELMEAQKQLFKPEKRLVADFLYPAKFKSKRPKLIVITGSESSSDININSINEDAFDSFKLCIKYYEEESNRNA